MSLDRPLGGSAPALTLPAGAVDSHCHVFQPGFGPVAGGPRLPVAAPDACAYRKVMAWLGIARTVVVQANAHQSDHGNLLAALAALGPVARGVAAVPAHVSEAELSRLHAAGVRGTRIMALPGGAVGLDALDEVDARIAPLGWTLVVQMNGTRLPEVADRLTRLQSPVVIDHHGKFLEGPKQDGAGEKTLLDLLEAGRIWVKFAGCMESSASGGPGFADVASLSHKIARVAPDRIIWGSNWPHNHVQTQADYPDDARLLDTVLGWLPDDRARARALVDTPLRLFDFPPLATS